MRMYVATFMSRPAKADRVECVRRIGADADEKPKLNLNKKRAFILGLKLTNIKHNKQNEGKSKHTLGKP